MIDPWTYFLVEEVIFPEECDEGTRERELGIATDFHAATPS
jgi:hypothetical protein